jgi:hypothetical protein
MQIELGRFLLTLKIERFDGLIGINSLFNKDLQVGFIDLDKRTEENSTILIKQLQKKHNLSDALLIRSSENNYHAVFFDLKKFSDWAIIELPINPEHVAYSIFRGVFVLRISRKLEKEIKFIKVIESEYGKDKTVSLAHIKFFERNLGIDLNYLYPEAIDNKDGQIYLEFYNARTKKII